jgi:uncharacterized protein (DUF2267 family)
MRRSELLRRIREVGGVATNQQADLVVREVLAALRSEMTMEQGRTVARYLPDEFRSDWIPDWGHPHDILEKEEMIFEPGVKG